MLRLILIRLTDGSALINVRHIRYLVIAFYSLFQLSYKIKVWAGRTVKKRNSFKLTSWAKLKLIRIGFKLRLLKNSIMIEFNLLNKLLEELSDSLN